MFDCSKCGACCKVLGCACYDSETKLCLIYDTRPSICRVDVMAEKVGIEKKLYYKITHEACKQLMDIVDNELFSPNQLPVSKYLEKNSEEVYR